MTDPDNIRRIEHAGREIVIVGTAHVSKQSVEEVTNIILEERPTLVCVELDAVRYRALTDPTYWQKLDIFQVIRQGKVGFLLANTALASVQRRIGRKLGVKPGDELLAAVRTAEQVGAALVLADRDIQVTFRRTWRMLSWWKKSQVLGILLMAPFASIEDELGEQEVENLKKSDQMSDALSAFAKAMPQVRAPLIDERDLYLVSTIREAAGARPRSAGETEEPALGKMVVVVGAAHVPGMLAHFDDPIDRDALLRVPPSSRVWAVVNWMLPVLILASFVYAYFHHDPRLFQNMVLAWVIPTGGLSALFTLVAGGKPATVLSALVAAPVTTLNPLIPVGLVTGLVEAWFRRPTVEDCERITDDVQSLRGIYKNRFTRVLLVTVLSILGAALGFWIGTYLVTDLTWRALG